MNSWGSALPWSPHVILSEMDNKQRDQRETKRIRCHQIQYGGTQPTRYTASLNERALPTVFPILCTCTYTNQKTWYTKTKHRSQRATRESHIMWPQNLHHFTQTLTKISVIARSRHGWRKYITHVVCNGNICLAHSSTQEYRPQTKTPMRIAAINSSSYL